MECDTLPLYTVEYAAASAPKTEGECSGDSVRLFESENGYFYSLISDGMGSGEEAGTTSGFVCDFMEKMLDFSASKDTVLHLLNLTLRQRNNECSATVDLFGIDLATGEATFIKSGAASSYVKRNSSIFRLRSKTAPLGLMSAVDIEKLKVEIRPEDYVIMFSDGICQGDEDSTWLLELLAKPCIGSLKDYAEYILSEAKRKSVIKDDMSVIVLKIKTSEEGTVSGKAS
jgi:stage II sporulation protein E